MSCGGYLFADEVEETEVVPEEPIAEETEDVSEAEVIIEDDSYVYELAEEPDVTDLSEDAEIEEIAEAIDDIGFLTADGVEINEDNFPDDVFREYVLENCDADHDGMLSEDEINGITTIGLNRLLVSGEESEPIIYDLTGIKYFTNLQVLQCSNHTIENFDVSGMTSLITLWCTSDSIKQLDVRGCSNLTELSCTYNSTIENIELDGCISLTSLDCSYDNLTSIDLSECQALRKVYAFNNNLVSINIGGNPYLIDTYINGSLRELYNGSSIRGLYLDDQNLIYCDSTVSISYSTEYDAVEINESNFPDSFFRSYVLSNYDTDGDGLLSLSESRIVISINIDNQGITDLSGIEYFPYVNTLSCNGNQISRLDLSNNSALWFLYCANNNLTYMDVSGCPDIYKLSCYGNSLESINLINCRYIVGVIRGGEHTVTGGRDNYYLGELYLFRCDFNIELLLFDPDIDETGGIELNEENFPDPNFRQFLYDKYDFNYSGILSVDEISNIRDLQCPGRGISDLTGIENLTELTHLNCNNNNIEILDLSSNPLLNRLECVYNNISSLNVRNNPSLNSLSCDNNNLTTLDISNNPLLSSFSCGNNNLTTLDLSNNTRLSVFSCINNDLSSLDVGNNTALYHLFCYGNNLTTIDISKNPYLIEALEYGEYSENSERGSQYYYEDENRHLHIVGYDLGVTIITSDTPSYTPGWNELDGSWYYIKEDGSYHTGWLTLSGKTYYLDGNGVMLTGKQKIASKWYYFKNNGEMVTGWLQIGGKWYYAQPSGFLVNCWLKGGNNWYFLNSDGVMVTGWQKIGNKWYYFNSYGILLTGWQKISNKWYYFNSSGAMLTGWQKLSGKWYYFEGSGAMKTGWLKSGGKWYYFESSGAMLSNCSRKIGSKTYRFDANGVCQNP